MKMKTILLTRGGAIAIGFIAVLFLVAANAYAIPLTNVNVTWETTQPYNGWYTDYTFSSKETGGGLDAFCVENALWNSGLQYELVSVPDYITDLTQSLAKEWFGVSGRLFGSTQSDYQIAIWHAQGVVSGNYAGSDTHVQQLLNEPYTFNFGNYTTMSLARSPVGGTSTPAQSQDYLIPYSVPEPATMLLLGTGLIGLAWVGRRKFFKK